MRPRRPALTLILLALVALCLGAPAAMATPFRDTAVVTLAQQTGGSFGGSRWGSGSSSTPSAPSGGSWSGGSSSSGRRSGGGSSSSHHSDGGGNLVLLFFYLVVWCFSVSPILGLAVLGVGIGFVVFMFFLRS